MSTLVTINQDTPARREITPVATLTYLYDRSRDSKNNSSPGQDFIAYRCDDSRLAFAVCDGVSQSFYGDLAAQFLGAHLVNWLSELRSTDDFAARLDEALHVWTTEASALVEAKSPSGNLAPMVRDAIEKKRQKGSEAMFVAGLLAGGKLAVCWMGDMRLWLWDADNEPVELPGAVWLTKERWSTQVGPRNGAAHTAILPLDSLARLTIHSDGVGSHAPELSDVSLDKLDELATILSAAPASDDVSILDIALVSSREPALPAPAPTVPDAREPVITWKAVDGAAWYRVEVTADTRQWTEDRGNTTFFIPANFGGSIRVQALANDRTPSKWSRPLAVASPVTAAEPEAKPSAPPRPSPAPAVTSSEEVGSVEALVINRRPFRTRLVMVSALLLAAVLLGWFLFMSSGILPGWM